MGLPESRASSSGPNSHRHRCDRHQRFLDNRTVDRRTQRQRERERERGRKRRKFLSQSSTYYKQCRTLQRCLHSHREYLTRPKPSRPPTKGRASTPRPCERMRERERERAREGEGEGAEPARTRGQVHLPVVFAIRRKKRNQQASTSSNNRRWFVVDLARMAIVRHVTGADMW